MELSDVLVPGSGLTARKVIAYIRNLPLGSATVAHLRGGDEFRGWNSQMYMLANVLDAIQQNTYVLVAANSKRKPKAPKPIPRPSPKANKNPMANKFAAMARIATARTKKRKKTADGSGAGR